MIGAIAVAVGLGVAYGIGRAKRLSQSLQAPAGQAPSPQPGPSYSEGSGWTNSDGSAATPTQVYNQSLGTTQQQNNTQIQTAQNAIASAPAIGLVSALEALATQIPYLRQLETYYRETGANYVSSATVATVDNRVQWLPGFYTGSGAGTFTHESQVEYGKALIAEADRIASEIDKLMASRAQLIADEIARRVAEGYPQARFVSTGEITGYVEGGPVYNGAPKTVAPPAPTSSAQIAEQSGTTITQTTNPPAPSSGAVAPPPQPISTFQQTQQTTTIGVPPPSTPTSAGAQTTTVTSTRTVAPPPAPTSSYQLSLSGGT